MPATMRRTNGIIPIMIPIIRPLYPIPSGCSPG
jgi:hypothetical protein